LTTATADPIRIIELDAPTDAEIMAAIVAYIAQAPWPLLAALFDQLRSYDVDVAEVVPCALSEVVEQ
jgi:hypothetical protein